MNLPRIAIIIGTTREGRFADRPARWLLDIARRREDAAFEIVDLRDYPMPFFDEPTSPLRMPPKDETARAWGRTLDRFDGFVFVTAEYNHGISGVLKNALDYAYPQFVRKPAGFLGYGAVGAARAVEQLRLNLVELQMAPLKFAVHIPMVEMIGLMRDGKDFADYPHLGQAAAQMLDDLLWWTNTLRTARLVAA